MNHREAEVHTRLASREQAKIEKAKEGERQQGEAVIKEDHRHQVRRSGRELSALENKVDDAVIKQQAENRHRRKKQEAQLQRVAKGSALFLVIFRGHGSGKPRQRRGSHASPQQFSEGTKDLEAVVQGRQRSGRKERGNDALHHHHPLPTQSPRHLRGPGAPQVTKRLAASGQRQRIAGGERKLHVNAQDQQLEQVACHIPQNHAVGSEPVESQEDKQNRGEVPDKPGRCREREVVATEQKGPQHLGNAGRNDDEEEPSRHLRRIFELRTQEARSDAVDNPG